MKPQLLLCTLPLLIGLQGCGGGGDAPEPPPIPTAIKAGDFELVAGTLAPSLPAGTARCQAGPAIGAALGTESLMAIDGQGVVYLLESGCHDGADTRTLIRVDTATGLMTATPVPYQYMPDTSQPAITKLSEPLSIAVAGDGSVLIPDGRFRPALDPGPNRRTPGFGLGIWRLTPAGQLTKLAGFDREHTVDPVDGQGGAATFRAFGTICATPGDVFYVADRWAARKVTLDGAVTTVADPDPAALTPLSIDAVYCGADRRAFSAKGRGAGGFGGPWYGWETFDLISGQAAGRVASGNPSITPLRHGFGDGWAVAFRRSGSEANTLFFADLQQNAVSAPWIRFAPESGTPAFQLDSRPYQMPAPEQMADPQVAVNQADVAYVRAGNALLRMKLPTAR